MPNPNGHPETLKPFQKGNTAAVGKGRPKGTSISRLLKELRDECELLGKPLPQGRTAAELLAQKMYVKAIKGQYSFAREILDRTEGKVPLRLADADGESIALGGDLDALGKILIDALTPFPEARDALVDALTKLKQRGGVAVGRDSEANPEG